MDQKISNVIQELENLYLIGEIISIITDVDITKTEIKGHFKDETNWKLKRSQQSNYETLLQVIMLRSNPIYISDPIKSNKQWSLFFIVEQQGLFDDKGELDVLYNDFSNVPFISGLTESKKFEISVWNEQNIRLNKISQE